MENQPETICPYCHFSNQLDAYFCSNCGKQIKDKPPSATVAKQITVYPVSLFLPPFGFWYAWKYLKQSDSKSKKIGIAALILTLISIIATIWYSVEIVATISQSINSLNANNLNF